MALSPPFGSLPSFRVQAAVFAIVFLSKTGHCTASGYMSQKIHFLFVILWVSGLKPSISLFLPVFFSGYLPASQVIFQGDFKGIDSIPSARTFPCDSCLSDSIHCTHFYVRRIKIGGSCYSYLIYVKFVAYVVQQQAPTLRQRGVPGIRPLFDLGVRCTQRRGKPYTQHGQTPGLNADAFIRSAADIGAARGNRTLLTKAWKAPDTTRVFRRNWLLV